MTLSGTWGKVPNMAFIVFEGLDGSGKSTLIKKLCAELKKQAIDFVTTREPGGTTLGEELRQIILRTDGDAPTPRTELLLYEAIRSQHVDQLITPALQQKKWVLCDRFTASTIAFQASGRNLQVSDVHWLNHFATEGLQPHLTILLNLNTQTSLERREQRTKTTGEPLDRFEREANDFHEKVRKSYLQQAKTSPDNWLILDAHLNPEDLFESLLSSLRQRQWLS